MAAFGHTLAATAKKVVQRNMLRYFPQVQVETPAPPVLCKRHIGKEAPAGVVLRLLAFLPKRVFSNSQLAFSRMKLSCNRPNAKC